MTRVEFEEYKAGRGSCLYRGRVYRGEGWQTIPGEFYAKGYNFRVDDKNYWFVCSSPEMLTSAYKFIPDEDQLKIDDTAEIVPTFNRPKAKEKYSFNCSRCGGPVDLETERCPKCGRLFILTPLVKMLASTIKKVKEVEDVAKEAYHNGETHAVWPETGRK